MSRVALWMLATLLAATTGCASAAPGLRPPPPPLTGETPGVVVDRGAPRAPGEGWVLVLRLLTVRPGRSPGQLEIRHGASDPRRPTPNSAAAADPPGTEGGPT